MKMNELYLSNTNIKQKRQIADDVTYISLAACKITLYIV